jgi:ABC-2 type transport system permease protein
MKSVKKYLTIYSQLLAFNLKFLAQYRANSIVRFFYGPAYVFVMYLILEVVYGRTKTLGGWTHEQSLMLFYVFQFMSCLFMFFFMGGIRDFMWNGIREGRLDMILTKPINAQFLISFNKPGLDMIFMLIGITILCIRQIALMATQIPLISFLFFAISLVFGLVICYFTLSTYATFAIVMTRSKEIIEVFDKFTDFSVYPNSIFPASVQVISFTLIPIAFFSYIPVSFLFGKGQIWHIPVMILVLIFSIIINQFAWKEGLKQYSSASS